MFLFLATVVATSYSVQNLDALFDLSGTKLAQNFREKEVTSPCRTIREK